GPAAAGRAALAAKDYDQAITCFDTALQLTPKESALYIERATAFEGKKQYDRAIKDLTEVIRLAPGGIEGYIRRGHAYAAKKDFNRAIADHTQAIQLDPKMSDGHTARGSDYEDMKDYEHAIADYSEAVRLNQEDVEAYNSLAWLWSTCPKADQRNGKLAVEYALYVCKLTEWKESNFMDTLAATYAEVGQFDAAVRWQTKALETPDSYDGKEPLDRARHRLKLYQEHKPFRSE
ncbi:MAG TPA: tetratricopeptide repeat protein, partial [Gemmataceae bacterium]|nr:tetratricopeptide repeat protein [Gemmataceae bacterium]